MAKNLYVGNLPFDYSEEMLRTLFKDSPSVTKATLITDSITGRARGFGFVEMSNDAEATAAITKLNGTSVGGRPIVVNEARPKSDSRGDRKGGGGGGGFRGGNGGGGGGGKKRW